MHESLLHENDTKDGENADTLTDDTKRNFDYNLVKPEEKAQGPKKTRIVIRDFAHTTYRAAIYYVNFHSCRYLFLT